jgi:16S rRNA (uracil1498-N3)-methyltransferase
MPRFYCPLPLTVGTTVDLPPSAARHVQVLRLQPGDGITLFNGEGGEHSATVTRMGRSDVQVAVQSHQALEREAPVAVHLAVGMPANDRMDWLVEKATELGVASIQPLMTAHSVLRLKGERADKKQAHWHSVAVAACEQCGRNRVPTIYPVKELADWLGTTWPADPLRWVLSLASPTLALGQALRQATHGQPTPRAVAFLSGPEGGLSPAEDAQARAAGWQPTTLGNRVLRAETAALAALTLATQPPPTGR